MTVQGPTVCVVGAGAIGTFIGARLSLHGCRVTAFARGATAASLRAHGFRLVQGGALVTAPVTDPLNTLPWLALVSVPLLVSVAAVAYVQRLRPRDLGLTFARWPEIVQQMAIALTGIPLGLVEFVILRPPAWIAGLTFGSLVLGGLVIFFATGFSEELIFRAILLKRAVEGLGTRGGLLYVTAIFASLHIFFLNGVDLVFVFAVGLFYGLIVLKTRNLWGVILSHSLGNVILYLVAPFLTH